MSRIKYKQKDCVGSRQLYRRVAKSVKNSILSFQEASAYSNDNSINTDSFNSEKYCNLRLNKKHNIDLTNLNDSENSTSSTSVSDNFNLNYDDNSDFNVEASNIFLDNNLFSVEEPRSSDELDINRSDNFLIKLKHWAISNTSVPHSAITELLHILSPYHPELPLDCRTLLKTPTQISTKQLDNGSYCHFGLSNYLKCSFLPNSQFESDTIKISFNIDGLPLFRSSNIQFWPILGLIKDTVCPPFVLGIFCGNAKPKPLSLFLEDFIDELSNLTQNGFDYKRKQYKVQIHSFVCDAPARAYLKCIKSHSGYSSCERCTVHGEYLKGRVIFRNISHFKRTDELFIAQDDEDGEYLKGRFPTDYMHCVCLGVMRKLLCSWVGGNLKVRLSSNAVNSISNKLVALKDFIPIEINRKPRTLRELPRFKATEFRTFLLYLGPLVLKNIVDVAVYEHFLLLHVGMAILLSKKHLHSLGYDLANNILTTFVVHSEKLYNSEFLVYNVHALTPLFS
ncbi:hypothetical protein QE152_g36557 [Popillia japonica]|uniref:Transposase domain-containing protein n=1 Tax=Popillia japonica TaxID=7064 RepID=A0AAW1ID62_POPJA